MAKEEEEDIPSEAMPDPDDESTPHLVSLLTAKARSLALSEVDVIAILVLQFDKLTKSSADKETSIHEKFSLI